MAVELQTPQTPDNNGRNPNPNPNPPNPNNTQNLHTREPQSFSEDIDSTCSTPYVSAPSSPGRTSDSGPVNGGFYYSAPASPMHFAMTSVSFSSHSNEKTVPKCSEFEFSARFGSNGSGTTGSMSSADELFLDGKIRPMKLSTHLERPQILAPLMDLEQEDEENEEKSEARVDGSSSSRGRDRDLRLRDKSMRRRTRSLSPLRSLQWSDDDFSIDDKEKTQRASIEEDGKNEEEVVLSEETTPSVSASSSRSSSAGRSSKRWIFLKEFLHRSKSEGRGGTTTTTSNTKFWSTISFSQGKEKKPMNQIVQETSSKDKLSSNGVENQKSKGNGGKKPVNGVGKRRSVPPSPHELHYKANRSQAEEMRKKTFLPYRQGLLGCLGFSSKGYGAMNGLARALNPVSSR